MRRSLGVGAIKGALVIPAELSFSPGTDARAALPVVSHLHQDLDEAASFGETAAFWHDAKIPETLCSRHDARGEELDLTELPVDLVFGPEIDELAEGELLQRASRHRTGSNPHGFAVTPLWTQCSA